MGIVFDQVEGTVQRSDESETPPAQASTDAQPSKSLEQQARELARMQQRMERLRAD